MAKVSPIISGTLYADKTVVNLEKFEFDEEQGGHYMARAGMSTVGDKRLLVHYR